MNQSVDGRIRERAYLLWKHDEGHRRSDEEYWLQAEREIIGEERSTPQEAAEKLEAQKADVEAEERKKASRSKSKGDENGRKTKAQKPEAEAGMKSKKDGLKKEEPKKGPRKSASKTSSRSTATAAMEEKLKS